MAVFKDEENVDGGEACYEHMNVKHGGIYDRDDPNYDSEEDEIT